MPFDYASLERRVAALESAQSASLRFGRVTFCELPRSAFPEKKAAKPNESYFLALNPYAVIFSYAPTRRAETPARYISPPLFLQGAYPRLYRSMIAV